MTNEEKAKAYDDALKIAQCWLNSPQTIEDCGYTVEDAIQSIFPALKESDNERIRKELIEFIKWSVDRHFMREDFHQAKRPSEWISYLEKQQERNVVPSRETILGIWELGNFWKEDPEEREGLTQLQYIQKYWNEKCDYQKEQKQKMEEQQ